MFNYSVRADDDLEWFVFVSGSCNHDLSCFWNWVMYTNPLQPVSHPYLNNERIC